MGYWWRRRFQKLRGSYNNVINDALTNWIGGECILFIVPVPWRAPAINISWRPSIPVSVENRRTFSDHPSRCASRATHPRKIFAGKPWRTDNLPSISISKSGRKRFLKMEILNMGDIWITCNRRERFVWNGRRDCMLRHVTHGQPFLLDTYYTLTIYINNRK